MRNINYEKWQKNMIEIQSASVFNITSLKINSKKEFISGCKYEHLFSIPLLIALYGLFLLLSFLSGHHFVDAKSSEIKNINQNHIKNISLFIFSY